MRAPQTASKRGLSRAFATFGPRAVAWLSVTVVASLALAFVELGISICLQFFLETLGLLGQDVQRPAFFAHAPSPAGLAVGLCLLAVGRSMALFLVNQGGNVAMEMIVARLRRIAIWEMLLHRSKAFVPAAALNARIGDLANKASQFAYASSVSISSAIQALALAGIMFVTARTETLVALVGLGIVGLLVLRLNQITRRIVARVPAELRVLTSGIERVARNTPLVRALRTEKIEHGRLARSIDTYSTYLVRAHYIGNSASAMTPFAGVLLILLIVATSQRLVHTPSMTLVSFLYLFVRFVQSISAGVHSFAVCNANGAAFDDCLDYVASFRPEEIEEATTVGAASDDRMDRILSSGGEPPSIEVRGLTFGYAGTSSNVLNDLSLTIDAGSQFAVVGPSGCGKSTLLGLLLGLFEPTKGEILIEGRSPAEFFADPSTRVGYVGAEAFLVAGSIRENLRYGLSAKADEGDLWDALSDVHLREVIEGLPGRLDYPIAEDGSGLSAGQKQRLCLARALLNRPHLLVLDEVSANLDSDTERSVAESLEKIHGRCTIILVSHREGMLLHADAILELDTMRRIRPTRSAHEGRSHLA